MNTSCPGPTARRTAASRGREGLRRAARGLDATRARIGAAASGHPVLRDGTLFVPTAAGPVRVRDSGGPAAIVVLACDPPNVLEHYDELVSLLAPDHRVVCLEMPGLGFSRPAGGFGFALEDYARTVEEVLDVLDARAVTLAFGCVWAYVALRVAAERLDLVDALVLVQAPDWDAETAWARRIDRTGAVRTPLVGQALLATAPVRIAQRWYRTALPAGHPAEPFLGPARTALLHGALFCLASFTQAWFTPDPASAPRFVAVHQPAVLLWDAADRTHRCSTPGLAAVPHARLLVHDHAGHFPELETPSRLVEALASLPQ